MESKTRGYRITACKEKQKYINTTLYGEANHTLPEHIICSLKSLIHTEFDSINIKAISSNTHKTKLQHKLHDRILIAIKKNYYDTICQRSQNPVSIWKEIRGYWYWIKHSAGSTAITLHRGNTENSRLCQNADKQNANVEHMYKD